MATPRPTEPVEKSTSSLSLVRDGIGLRAAERAEALQLLARLAAEQVLDGVEDRAGVRLDRDAVLRAAARRNRAPSSASPTDAHDAWWPPTFSPSRLGRRWLALWIIQDESHSTLRSSALISAR